MYIIESPQPLKGNPFLKQNDEKLQRNKQISTHTFDNSKALLFLFG